MESFRKLGLSEAFVNGIKEAKFEKPSEIQEKTIPLALAGKDVIGGSATGSGKTLAFGASIIEHTEKGKGIQALILTPTRELAEQITKVMKHFSKFKGLGIASVYGGVGYSPQVAALEKSEIVVATPGRTLDHLKQGTVDFSKVKILVLDEADRMLDMGFIHDVESIIKICPKKRQTMLFSATINQDISHIAKKFMDNPVEVSAENYIDPSLLKQIFYDVPSDIKFSLLVHLLKNEKSGLVMVFCNTRHNTDFVARNLNHNGIEAMATHGGLSQDKRNKVLEKFHAKNVYILVCTDVAARGLDIKGVSHIYNYDSPKTSKEYIHRIGRTARAGADGIAISIVSNRDYDNFRHVLEDPVLKIKQEPLPEIQKVGFKISESSDRGHGRSEGFRGRSGFGGGSRSEGSRDSRGGGGFRGRSGFGSRGSRSEGSRDSRGGGGFRGRSGFGSRGRSGGSRSGKKPGFYQK